MVAPHARPQGEILEELVSSVRNVEMRFREAMDEDVTGRRRRKSRIHPMMMREMAFRIGEGPRDPIQILVIASFLREDFPWMYELALEAYRAFRSGKHEEARSAYRRFIEATEMLRRGPFLEEFGMDSKWLHMFLHEGLQMFDLDLFEDPEEAHQAAEASAPRVGNKKKNA